MHPGCRIEQLFLCRDPVDFRKSIGGLSVLVEQALGLDPFGSALYVFINRERNKIKVLYWHRNGFCLWLKRLEAEKFAWPRDADGATHKPARGKRAPLPAEFKRVDVVHELPAAERTCPCGTPMVEIGEEVSEQLDLVPMQVRVLRHIRKRYGCPGSVHAPVTAALPPQPLPKSNASADLLAMLLVVKFIDGLPLARWVIGAAGVLQPLLNLMRDALLEGPFLHVDETVVQVLKEPGKAPTSNSYMWVQAGGPPGRPVVVFDYDASRSGQVPVRLLHDYRGYVMTDGYSGYNELMRTDGIEQLVCWAHVRRRFVEAVNVQPQGKRGLPDDAVALIGKLYGIERDHKGADDATRLLARQTHRVPVLAALRA